MNTLIWIGAAALGVFALSKSKSHNQSGQNQAGTLNPTAAQNAQLVSLNNQSNTFNAQAQQLGLTPQQAQDASDIGLTPQEYADGVLSPASGSADTPYSGDEISQTPADTSASGLYATGDVEATTGAPIYSDDYGSRCILSLNGRPVYF